MVEKAEADGDILAVVLFGSRARGDQRVGSDTDICLVLQPSGCTPDVTELSHTRLRYLKDFDLDIHVYQQLPVYIRRRVLKEGTVLFCRDEDLLYQVAFRTAQEFEHFRHL
jgi:predicted nucleotidyltransferase